MEIAVCLISTRLPKVFSTGLLEMEKVQESRHFHMSKAISADMKACPAGASHIGEGRTSSDRLP